MNILTIKFPFIEGIKPLLENISLYLSKAFYHIINTDKGGDDLEIKIEHSSNAKVIHKIMSKAYAEYINDPAPSSALSETVSSINNALLDGQKALIGSIAGQPIACVRYLINEHGLYFFRMSVLPTMQGLGIAKQLLLALEGIARDSGVHTINCKVRVSVLRNLQLYQSKGYAIYNQQVVEADNGTKIDIVTMTKTISN
ncbi:GNAT family N-acetyltransferase [Kurthia zopfii]|nr:GNAT family N-acetyltransferase [Kurthia zopfii]